MSKKLRITLLIEAAVCFVVALSMSGAKAEWIAFPYAQIGTALRALSLSGAAGNLIAWAILILIACLPLGWLAFARAREKACVHANSASCCDGATDTGECGATNACGCDGATDTGECGAANNGKCSAANACGCDGAANNDECDAANARSRDSAANVRGCDVATDNDEIGAANARGCDGTSDTDECGEANARVCDGAANARGCDVATDNDECRAANTRGCDGASDTDECDAANNGKCSAANTRGCDGASDTDECDAANNGKCSAANACGCDGAANTRGCDGATDTGECGATNACGCDGTSDTSECDGANNDKCGAANARGCDGAANNDKCDGATDTDECDAANARGCDGMTNNDESDSMNARSRDSAAVCGKSCRGIFRGRPENWLMVLLSGLLIPGIYGAVNPEWLAGVLGLPDGAFSAAMASGCLNAILVAYIALRILRRTREGGRALLKGLNAMLIAAMIALVAAAFLGVTANVRDGFLNVAAGNTEGGLGMTYCMLILGGIVDALPMLGDLWALDAALGLVSARMNGEDGVSEAKRLVRRSSRVIAATVLSRAALNLLAALTARWNRAISLNVNLPVESLLIALALMLAARGIAENKRLRDDNALFI